MTLVPQLPPLVVLPLLNLVIPSYQVLVWSHVPLVVVSVPELPRLLVLLL